MSRTLLVLATHFIDENVISEYRKMKNTPNVDAVLAINNNECEFDFKNRVEDRIFFDTNCRCFFFDSKLNEEFGLPIFIDNNKNSFEKTNYHNGDFRFYYIRKYFSDYDYYWQIEYDVFCNAENYVGFLDKFANNYADLLIQNLKKQNDANDSYVQGTDWIYHNLDMIYVGVFPVVRLSARAIDFLYHKRLEHGNIFRNSAFTNKQWVFCEVFVPTELMNDGFICENLNEKRIRFLPHIYLNDERIFLQPDNHLYHPVKSVNAEISKLQKQYADLFFCFRKNFLIHLAEKLNYENFNFMLIDLTGNGGGLRCETWFINDIYGNVAKLYSAVVFEGDYLEHFKIIEQYIAVNKIPSVQILENSKCKMLAYGTTTFDNVQQVANVSKILIEMTFTILQEKIL